MGIFRSTDSIVAVFLAVFSLFVLVVWIPNDIETGMIETFRRQTFIGDALIPTIAACAALLCSLVLFATSLMRGEKGDGREETLDRESFGFLLVVALIVVVSLAVMYWLGPLAVSIFEGDSSYRAMRDTVPYKYLGYLFGGSFLMLGLISLVEGSIRLRRLAISLAAVVLLIVIFDVPFDSLLLPPNGDW